MGPTLRHCSFPLGLGVLALGLAAWVGCGTSTSAASAPSGGSGGAYTSGLAASGSGGTVIDNDGRGGSGGATPTPLQALCGGGCTPGTAVATPCELPPDGGGGSGGNSGPPAPPPGTCELTVNAGHVEGVCGIAGQASDGEPCLSVHDCAPGFACVEPGVCRAYCCGDAEACAPKTFCAKEALVDDASLPGGAAHPIPVCSPVETCTLLDDATCATAGNTCTIVREDGTTSCVPPGKGEAADPCPCGAGYVCSFATNRCLKLCRTSHPEDCPSGHQCSGGSKPYPPGFGVCVEL